MIWCCILWTSASRRDLHSNWRSVAFSFRSDSGNWCSPSRLLRRWGTSVVHQKGKPGKQGKGTMWISLPMKAAIQVHGVEPCHSRGVLWYHGLTKVGKLDELRWYDVVTVRFECSGVRESLAQPTNLSNITPHELFKDKRCRVRWCSRKIFLIFLLCMRLHLHYWAASVLQSFIVTIKPWGSGSHVLTF
jgi:hypothetical protein